MHTSFNCHWRAKHRSHKANGGFTRPYRFFGPSYGKIGVFAKIEKTKTPTQDDTGNIRFGANPDTVVRSYLDEYKAEHIFRLLKSGIGMDKVYLHKGSRVAAMFFIAGIAGTLLSVMDEMLRRGNAGTTTNMMKLSLLDTTVRIKRSTGYKYIDGHSGSGAEIEKYCQILDLDPELLLGRS